MLFFSPKLFKPHSFCNMQNWFALLNINLILCFCTFSHLSLLRIHPVVMHCCIYIYIFYFHSIWMPWKKISFVTINICSELLDNGMQVKTLLFKIRKFALNKEKFSCILSWESLRWAFSQVLSMELSIFAFWTCSTAEVSTGFSHLKNKT